MVPINSQFIDLKQNAILLAGLQNGSKLFHSGAGVAAASSSVIIVYVCFVAVTELIAAHC